MALLLRNGAVFLHIPKTGGNWVTSILYELNLVEKKISPKHSDIRTYFSNTSSCSPKDILKRIVNKSLFFPRNKPFMFCFVRNPLSWYESWFKYMSQPSRNWRYWGDENDIRKWHPNATLNGLISSDFNQFVRNVIRKRPGYVTELYGWYTNSLIDFIGKQENLANDFMRVLKIMNVDFDEGYIRKYNRIGESPKPKKKIYWETGLREEVTLLEYAGMVRYGYPTEIAIRS